MAIFNSYVSLPEGNHKYGKPINQPMPNEMTAVNCPSRPEGLGCDGDIHSGILPIMVRSYGYGSIPINTIFSGMNIHLPAILGFTRYQGFDPSPYGIQKNHKKPMVKCGVYGIPNL